MASYDVLIDDLVCGDDYDFERTITLVPDDTELAKAWLTIKRRPVDTDANAVVQKTITTTEVSGQGQITDSGAGDETAYLFFQLTAAETARLEPRRLYAIDVQVLTASGKKYTPLVGRVRPIAGVTKATA